MEHTKIYAWENRVRRQFFGGGAVVVKPKIPCQKACGMSSTINNLYIHPYNMNAIHLSNGYDVYIIPKKNYIKNTVLLVDKSLVLAGGILKDNTIIWNRKIRLDKVCFMYIDIEKHPEVYTNEIMANVILNNLR